MANTTSVSKAPATTTEPVKAFGKNKSRKDKYYQPRSDKDTQPIRDVIDNDGNLIEGISEEQKIREGVSLPFLVRPNFKKDDFERKEWKRVHTNRKGPTGGSIPTPKRENKYTLLVHLKNTETNKERRKFFRTTINYKAGQSEIAEILKGLIDNGSVVKKTIYRGQTTIYNG